MSNTVDERIVEMQFNNGEFEKGIQESLKSLEALKKGLELDKSSKSLDNLSKIVSNVDFSGMAKGIETISNRFTTMGIIGMRALQNITDKVMAMSERWVKSVTVDQISAGFNKYAQKTEAVQTIMSATGKTVEEVEEVLGRLNEYTDWTSFNFAEMTTTIGKFTSSGVDLEVAEKAMEGIGNEASLAGATIQNANHAMYNFAQALATGKVQLMDWKSIENANMATKQFKETIIDTAVELGTLKRGQDGVSKTTKGTIVDYTKFNATLSEGWFTSDVLIKTLEKYADTTTELGQKAFDAAKKAITFGQAIDSIKDAVSTGWMNTFQLIFGNFEEASELWTGFADGAIDALSQFSEARNSLLNGWRDLNGEDGRKILLDGLVEIFQVLGDILTMVKYVVKEFFPPITASHLMAISKGVKEFADGLYEAVHATEMLVGGGNSLFSAGGPELNLKGNVIEKIEELQGVLKKGDKNDEVKQLQLRLMELGYSLDEHGADGIFGPETQKALKDFQTKAGITVDGIYGKQSHEAMGKALAKDIETAEGPLENVENYVYNLTEGLTTLQRIARGFFAVVHIGAKAGAFIVNVIKSALTLLKPLGNVLLTVGAVIGDCLVSLDRWLTESGIYEQALGAVQNALAPIGDWISKISKSITDFLTTGPKIESFADLWDRFKTVLLETDFGKSLAGAFERIKKTKFFEGMSKFLSNIQVKFKTFVNWVKFLFNWTKSGAKPMGKYTGIIDKFRQGIEKVKEVFSNFPNKIVDFGESVYGFVKNLIDGAKQSPAIQAFVTRVSGLFTLLKNRVGDFISNVPSYVSKMGDFFKNLLSGDIDLKATFTDVTTNIGTWISNLCDKLDSSGTLSKAWEGTKGFFNNLINDLKEFAGLVGDAISNFFGGGSGGGSGSNSLFTATDNKEEGAKGTVFDQLRERLSSFDSVIDWIKSKWEEVKGKVSEFVESVKEFFGGGSGGAKSGDNGFFDFDFDKVAKGFWDAVKKFNDFLAGFWRTLKDTAPLIVDLIESISAIFAIKKAGKMFDSISKFLKGYRKDVQPLALSILEIAGAIALIAGAIYILGSLETGQLVQGGIAIVVIAGVLLGFLALSKKIGGKLKGIGQMGSGLLEIAGAIAILAGLAWLMQLVGWKTLASGLLKIAVIMLLLVGFIALIQFVNKKAGASGFKMVGLVSVAGAIAILAGLAVILGKIKFSTFISGVVKLVVLMAVLAGFMKSVSKLDGKNKFKGLMSAVIAIGLMALITKALGKAKVSVLVKGILSLYAITGVLKMLMKSLSSMSSSVSGKKGGFNSLLGMAGVIGAVYALTLIVEKLGNMKPLDALQGIAMLGIIALVMKSLANTMAIMSKVGVGGSASAVGSFAVFAAGVTGVIVILNGILGAIDEITGGKFAELLARGGAVLGGIIGGFVSGIMGALNSGETKPTESKSLVQQFSDFLDELEGVSSKLETVFDSFQPFFDKVGGVDESVYNGMHTLVETMLLMTGEGILESISKVVTDGEGGLNVFVDNLSTLAEKLSSLGDAASGVDEETATNINKLIDPMNSLGEIAKASAIVTIVGALDNIAAMITGKDNLEDFIDHLGTLAEKLNSLGTSASGIGEGTASNIDKLAGPMGSLGGLCGSVLGVSWTEALTSLADMFAGEDDTLSGFVDRLTHLVPRLAGLALACAPLGDTDTIANLVAPMQSLSSLSSAVTGVAWSRVLGRVVEFVAGKDSVEQFIDSMITVAPKLVELSTACSDMTGKSTEGVVAAANIIGELGKAASKIPKEGGLLANIFGDVDYGSFATGMEKLGTGLKSFATATADLKDVTIDTGDEKKGPVAVIEKLAEIQASLEAHDGLVQKFTGEKDLGMFGQKIQDLGGQFVSFNNDIEGMKLDKFNEFITALSSLAAIASSEAVKHPEQAVYGLESMVGLLSEAIGNGEFVPQLLSIGDGIASSIQQGIGDSASFDGSAAISPLATKLSTAAKGLTSQFQTIGKQIVQGLANGITLNTFIAVSAAQRLMGRVRQAAADTVEIESPSKVFAEMGMFIDKGLANGLIKYSGVAEKAASGVMDSTLSSTQNLLSNLSEIVANGIDPNPTITPVLDLSNITAGSGQIGGILSGFGIGANLNFRGPANVSLAEKYGNTDVVDAINNLNGRMNEMATAISNMQVVMETGALVGQISTSMDQSLGRIAATKGRMG